MSTIGRAPKDYNAGAWGRIVGRIDKAINTLANRLGAGEAATRELQITQREQRATLASMLTPEATFEWSEYVDPSTERVYGQCIVEVTRGWGIISDFEYREGNGNVDSLTTWTSYKTGPNMSFVPDATYKGGGYYLYRKELPFIKGGDRVSLVSVDLRGKAANGDVWVQSSHTFDANKVPQFKSEPKLVLQWDTANTKWNVRAIGEADNDTLSVGFIVSDNTQLSESDGFAYTDFTTGVTNITTNDKRFNVSLGSFSPSTELSPRILYVAAGAFDAANATPDNPDNEFSVVLLSIEIPLNPELSGTIGDGDITGDMLADVVKIASVNLIANHNGSTPSSVIDVSGTIEYRGDTSTGNPYTIGSQSITLDTTGVSQSAPNGPLTYIYFDPSLSATTLQVTTSKSVATDVTGKRIFVGIGRAHFAERAFFVFANDQPVFSAPFIFASKLEALTGKMGTLYAGAANFKIGDEVSSDGLGGYNDGIYINANNYWYDTGIFKVGDANSNVLWDNNTLSITGKINVAGTRIGKDVGYLTGTGTEPTAGEHGIWINPDNYWILDTNASPDEEYFKVGDSTSSISWNAGSFDITSRSSDLSKRVQILNGVILAQNASGTAYLSGSGLNFLDSTAAEYDANSISSLDNFSINTGSTIGGLNIIKDLTLNPTGKLYFGSTEATVYDIGTYRTGALNANEKVIRFLLPRTFQPTAITAALDTAPSGGSLTVTTSGSGSVVFNSGSTSVSTTTNPSGDVTGTFEAAVSGSPNGAEGLAITITGYWKLV